MVHPHWIVFGYFMAGVLAVALYGLTASGHFPAEARSAKFKDGWGSLVLWGTLAVTALAAAAMLLCAPLLLQPLPDSFVNGRRGLVSFSTAAIVVAGLMWWWA